MWPAGWPRHARARPRAPVGPRASPRPAPRLGRPGGLPSAGAAARPLGLAGCARPARCLRGAG
eukprot:11712483-Alexandrium_andersonii.AAC.1